MEIKELRIGNFVKLMLNHEDYKTLELTLLNMSSIDKNHGYYEPIPLTPEWLLKFGFDKLPDVFEYKRFYLYKEDNSDIWRLNHSGTNAHITTLKYVHQLQNLYYFLCDEELTSNFQIC